MTTNGLILKTPDDVQHEPLEIDPRISRESLPRDVDLSATEQLKDILHGHHSTPKSDSEKTESDTLQDVIYVEFEDGDPTNPANFSHRKKYAMAFVACGMTLLSALASSAFSLGIPSMMNDLSCTKIEALTALSTYTLGFAITPLITASFSEEFGRNPLYIVSGIGFILMFVMIAEAKNIATVIVARLFQGAFGSTGSTMVGGTIADMFSPDQRGIPMTIFTIGCFAGASIGPIFSGYVEMDSKLGWKWIEWIQMIVCGAHFILIPLFMRETRSSVLLAKRAQALRKSSGDSRYRARVEDERASLRTLILVSCTRPIYLLFREPVVASFSAWIGFAWGVFYVFIESVTSTFTKLHGFNTGQSGLVFIAMLIGTILGVSTNFLQERLYRKNAATREPEARLYLACAAAIIFPTAMFIYAWCAFPHVHWIAQAIALALFIWAAFIMYLAVFTYLADCYGPFASSALAGQSMCRNIAATAFPLFTEQMFAKLGYNWGATLFAFVGVVMIPIPYLLFFYGPSIRRRSKFSSQVMESSASK